MVGSCRLEGHTPALLRKNQNKKNCPTPILLKMFKNKSPAIHLFLFQKIYE